jgi:hypothetical protein
VIMEKRTRAWLLYDRDGRFHSAHLLRSTALAVAGSFAPGWSMLYGYEPPTIKWAGIGGPMPTSHAAGSAGCSTKRSSDASSSNLPPTHAITLPSKTFATASKSVAGSPVSVK